jgi:predicted HicB family RNase H-like nuclease
MVRMMHYKGYSGVAEIAYDTGMIYGRVVGLRDVITFQGHTVPEAERAFRDSVDDYLEFCASRGEPPERPFSGRFLVRISPALHRDLVAAAEARGVSLNSLVGAALSEAFPSSSTTTGDAPAAGAIQESAPSVDPAAPKPKRRVARPTKRKDKARSA